MGDTQLTLNILFVANQDNPLFVPFPIINAYPPFVFVLSLKRYCYVEKYCFFILS